MKVMLAQVNPTVADLMGNWRMMQDQIHLSVCDNCDVIVFPELVTVGYPPRDLLYDPHLWAAHDKLVDDIHHFVSLLNHHITVIFGGLHSTTKTHGMFARYNAAFIVDKTHGVRVVHKRLLPCYDVFDETRYFQPDSTEPYLPLPIVTDSGTVLCDVLICEDIWNFNSPSRVSWMSPGSYATDPVSCLRSDPRLGPLFVLNGSPWWTGKIARTTQLVMSIAEYLQRPVCWVNQVGAHDDIVFHGGSMIVSSMAGLDRVQCASLFETDMLFNEFVHSNPTQLKYYNHRKTQHIRGVPVDYEDFDIWCLYSALRLGLLEYLRKIGISKIVFGASGGIDSAVVGAIAAQAIGGENCTAITMPSDYSSEGSWKDAELLAQNCGMHFLKWDIADLHTAARSKLLSGGKQRFDNPVTDENIQPRARGLLLMMYSNEEGALLLSTGNKSELAVGYCTIYGDMCGGFALLSDVPKTMVYRLARFINKYFDAPIPESTISKPPSAELSYSQKDTDTLPPYETLDPLLEDIFSNKLSYTQLRVKYPGVNVGKIQRMINNAEFKRYQAPCGIKVSERAFGTGRRIPIAKKISY